MRCKQCGGKAVMVMRHYRQALCREHYLDWFVAHTARTIEKYHMLAPQDRLLVAVSGGKDSLSVWDVLWRLGYQAEGLYIHLGIEGEDHYSDSSLQFAADFAAQRGLTLHVAQVNEILGKSIPQVAAGSRRGQNRACGVCGLVKRHIMNQTAAEGGYHALITGHNLDDEASVLLANLLSWSVEQVRRQEPVLAEEPGFARKVKPLCRFYERETAAYALLRGIPYIEDECPFSEGSKTIYYKEVLNRLEADRTGAKLNFYTGFLHARKHGLFGTQTTREKRGSDEWRLCPKCGSPTSSEGLCSFCRLVETGKNDLDI